MEIKVTSVKLILQHGYSRQTSKENLFIEKLIATKLNKVYILDSNNSNTTSEKFRKCRKTKDDIGWTITKT